MEREDRRPGREWRWRQGPERAHAHRWARPKAARRPRGLLFPLLRPGILQLLTYDIVSFSNYQFPVSAVYLILISTQIGYNMSHLKTKWKRSQVPYPLQLWPFSLLQFLAKLIEKGILSLLSSSSLPGLSPNHNIQAPPPPTSCPCQSHQWPHCPRSSAPRTCRQHLAGRALPAAGLFSAGGFLLIPLLVLARLTVLSDAPGLLSGSLPLCTLSPGAALRSSDCLSSPDPFRSQFCLLSRLIGLLPWMS